MSTATRKPGRRLACGLLALMLATASHAACLGKTPEEAARAFFQHHRKFYWENPASLKPLLAPRLYADLVKNYRCAQHEVCALDWNPWVSAQDGNVAGPLATQAVSATDTNASVRLSYWFILSPHRKSAIASTLQLEKRAGDTCWRVADLIMPKEGSLTGAIEDYFRQYPPAK